jgi:hypothetical protein
MNKTLHLIGMLFPFVLFLLTGCVAGRTYRSSIPAEVVESIPDGTSDASIHAGKLCQPKTTAADFDKPCIAYVEFDDLGELRVAPGDIVKTDKAKTDANGKKQTHCDTGHSPTPNPSQVDIAKDLICSAMKPAKDELSQPIVLVFVHGWKHNASQKPVEDANVQGVKDFLNALKRHYPDSWVRDNQFCEKRSPGCQLLRHPVIGIYIAWRGDSVSHYFPVARTFSVFDREATAYRVGNTSLTDAITEISAVAHPLDSDKDPYQPFLLMMGHSFGGLILERTLAQALMEHLDDPANSKFATSLADLVVYVNTAVAATDSKQVIDLLARHESEGGVLNSHSTGPLDKRYPFIVSLSSVDDQATLSLVTVGHGLPALGRKLVGSARAHVPMLCYEPETKQAGRIDDFSQTDFFLHTAPHFEAMQSHEVKALPKSQCGGADAKANIEALYQLGGNRPENELREWLKDSFGPTPVMGNSCYAIVPKNSLLKPKEKSPNSNQRCNGTPYFVMEVPHEIIPDHGTIFTQRHLQLLTMFLPQAVGSETDAAQPQKGVLSKRQLKAQ